MEFLIFLALIGVAIIFTLAKSSRSSINTEEHKPQPPARVFDPQTARPQSETIVGKARIVDGDTIVIQKNQIRLFGIDAPEIDHPFGQKSKWALVSLCKGQVVNAVIKEKDSYGRTVALCTLPDGRDLSAEMVKLGLAIDWPKYSGGSYSSLEVPSVRKKLWLADARQKGQIHVWEKFEAAKSKRQTTDTS